MAKNKQLEETDNQVSSQTIKLLIEEVRQSIEKNDRKTDALQRSIDLLEQDRQILENILGSITELKQLIVSHREHQDSTMKDVKMEVTETKETVQDNIGTLVDSIDKKKIVVMKDSSTLDYLKKIFKIHKGGENSK
jgi:methyl-accepting chemotaxis protein